jgi:hypothetical protein
MKSFPLPLGVAGYLSFAIMVLFVTGCPKPIPRVSVPALDATPPTMVWETYNMQTKARGEMAQDGQSLDVPSDQQSIITLAVEDLESGVKSVTLSGQIHYACAKDGHIENKQYALETQEAKPMVDQENKVPIRASLVYVVEFGKMGCKEFWTFGGGNLTLVGKAQNSLGGTNQRTLHVQVKKPA